MRLRRSRLGENSLLRLLPQECPHDFTRHDGAYNQYNDTSCQGTNEYEKCSGPFNSYSSSLPLPVEGRSYSSECGRVRGRGWGQAFYNAIDCNASIEQPYVSGVSLTHGLAGRRSHIWTFAAAGSDGVPLTLITPFNCGCSNANLNWTHATPEYVGNDYFCDSNRQYTEGSIWEEDEEDDLWDGKGCDLSSSCCEWNNPPYFCKHLHNTTSEDMELRLFSFHRINKYPTVSLIEIFVK